MAPKPDLKAEGKELATLLADARKRPLNFAILLTGDGMAVQADKVKSVEAMRKAAKSAGGGAKGAWGQMSAEGRKLILTCENDPPGGFAKQLQRHFSERGQMVQVLFAGDEEPEDEAAPVAQAPQDPRRKPDTAAPAPDTAPEEEDGDEDDHAAEAGDLAALIKAARKKPYNFACLLTDGGVVLKGHRRKPPEVLVRLAKAEGGSAKGGWGRMSVEGKLVVLTCLEDAPQTLARRTKMHLKAFGIKAGVKLATPSGEVIEAEEDSLDQAPAHRDATPAVPAQTPPAPDASRALAQDFRSLAADILRGPAASDLKLAQKVSGMTKLFVTTMGEQNMEKAAKLLEFLKTLAPPQGSTPPPDPRPEPGRPIWENGANTGAQIATQNGYPVYARKRVKGDFGAQDEATAYGRSLSVAVALLVEKGRYVIYEAEIDSNFLWGDRLNRKDLENSRTEDPDDTDLVRNHPDMVALVSTDDIVVRTATGVGRIDRDGNILSPFQGQLAVFGPGMARITDRKQFESQFELVMRDSAYAAINAAQEAAEDAKARFAAPLSEADRATMGRVFDDLAPIRAEREAKEKELLLAQMRKYSGYAELASEYMNPLLIPINRLRDFAQEKLTGTEKPDDSAEVARISAELAQIKARETAAAADFPLAMRVENLDSFRAMTPEAQAAALRGHADGVLEDIVTTRKNIDKGKFDFWTMPGIRDTAMAGMGLSGDQLQWAQDKADWEGKKDTAAAVAEGVIGIGLGVAAVFASGGTALVLGAGALAVGGYGAYDVTETYFRNGSAANIALDPTQGLIPEEDVPHWGWVAASWIGLGLDASSVRAAVKALKAGAQLSDVAKTLGVAEEVLAPALKGKNLSGFKAAGMASEAFDARYGASTAEAVTTITRNTKGGFDVEVVVRMGGDPALRQAAVAEELRHVQQLNDPAFADDFARLTEGALADWPAKPLLDKMRAARSQMRLEADSQQSLIADLTRRMEGTTDPARRAVLQSELDEAAEALGEYQRHLGDLDAGLASGRAPATFNLDHPPRLFMRPQTGATKRKALEELPGLDDALKGLEDADAYTFAKVGDRYEMRRIPEGRPGHVGDARPKRLRFDDGTKKWTIEDAPAISTEARQETVKALYGKPTGNATLEAAISGFDTPFKQAYARKYENALAQLDKDGGSIADVMTGLGTKSDTGFEHALRDALRNRIIERVKSVGSAEEQTAALRKYIELMPDNGARGKLFSAFREGNMGPGMTKVAPPAPNSMKLKGQTRYGDGLVDYAAPAQGSPPKGPQSSGRFLAEDKSSAGAFDMDQFQNYVLSMKSNNGKIVTETGEQLDGLIYFFPDRGAATRMLDAIAGLTVDPNVHIGYLRNGRTVWLR
ncbi:MAG: hypothetical protein ACK4RN_03635 [Pseudorhodobacter sp.]